MHRDQIVEVAKGLGFTQVKTAGGNVPIDDWNPHPENPEHEYAFAPGGMRIIDDAELAAQENLVAKGTWGGWPLVKGA